MNWARLKVIAGRLAAAALVLGVGGSFLYDVLVVEPLAVPHQRQLENEFRIIVPLPDAEGKPMTTMHGPRKALVSAHYRTGRPEAEIRSYYDHELAQHGWVPLEVRSLRDWGRDLGGWTASWCKGAYTADLQYAGAEAHYGWAFALGLSWHPEDADAPSRRRCGKALP